MSKLAPTRTADEIIGFVIHHSADRAGNEDKAAIKARAKQHDRTHSPDGRQVSWGRLHTNAQMGYSWINYHYSVAQNGDTIPLQPWEFKRYHAGDDFRGGNSFNRWGIGILIEGNFDLETPSEASLQAAAKIIYEWERRYSKGNLRVIGHKETGATRCPGTNMGLSTIVGSPVWKIRDLANQLHGDDPTPIPDDLAVVIARSGLNVRPDPNTNKPPIGSLRYGETVQVLDRDEWATILWDDGLAYVYSRWLDYQGDTNTEGKDEIMRALDYVQGRAEAMPHPDRMQQLQWLSGVLEERLTEI